MITISTSQDQPALWLLPLNEGLHQILICRWSAHTWLITELILSKATIPFNAELPSLNSPN